MDILRQRNHWNSKCEKSETITKDAFKWPNSHENFIKRQERWGKLPFTCWRKLLGLCSRTSEWKWTLKKSKCIKIQPTYNIKLRNLSHKKGQVEAFGDEILGKKKHKTCLQRTSRLHKATQSEECGACFLFLITVNHFWVRKKKQKTHKIWMSFV